MTKAQLQAIGFSRKAAVILHNEEKEGVPEHVFGAQYSEEENNRTMLAKQRIMGNLKLCKKA